MANVILTESKLITRQDVKELGSTAGPCVTILLPVTVAGKTNRSLSGRLESAVTKAEEKLGERSVASETVRKFGAAIRTLIDRVDEEASGETLAVFASEAGAHHYWMPEKLDETVIAADNFYVRPFLKKLEGERQFYILALSQKDIRLLRCTEHTSEEVDLAGRIPTSLREDMQTDQPDHVLDNRSSAGASSGSTKGVMFGTGTDREAHGEYLLHFYKDVSKGISEVLKGQEKTPLVVCGVEYELALYKTVNAWPNTCPEGVRGAPNGLKGGEMHARALECLDKMYDSEIETILAHHDKQAGDAATAGVNDLVKAAYEGRVLHLLVAENAQAMGNFDEASHRARTHLVARSGDEDLLNAAAIQTIIHGGRVHLIPQSRVPANRPMAAVMRY